MPFDGGNFSPFQPSGPLPHEPERWSRARATLSRLRSTVATGLSNLKAPALAPAPAVPAFDPSVGILLQSARALIGTESCWAKGTYRTTDGRHCAAGALHVAALGQYGRRMRRDAHGLLLAVARERGFDSVERMNDASTHAQVLSAFDMAVKHSRGSRAG